MEADEYCQVRGCLVVKARLPDGGVTTLVLNPATGEFEPDLRFLVDFHVSWKNDPDYLERDEFLSRAALQVSAKRYVDVGEEKTPALAAISNQQESSEAHESQSALKQMIVERIERARTGVITGRRTID